MRTLRIASLILIILTFILALYFYNSLPDRIASHWGINGEVNGTMARVWIFLVPGMSLALFLLFLVLPLLDPLKKNYPKFRRHYEGFVFILVLFMSFIFLVTLLWNLGYELNINRFIALPIAVLLLYAGILISNSKRNWFVGIRTPWTLSSDAVWDETHRVGGVLFKISGVIAFLGVVFPSYTFWFILVPVLLSALFSVIYSYVVFRRMKK